MGSILTQTSLSFFCNIHLFMVYFNTATIPMSTNCKQKLQCERRHLSCFYPAPLRDSCRGRRAQQAQKPWLRNEPGVSGLENKGASGEAGSPPGVGAGKATRPRHSEGPQHHSAAGSLSRGR